jgi:hypothetical protein
MTDESGQGENKPTIKTVNEKEFADFFDRLEGQDEGWEIKLYRRHRKGTKAYTTFLRKYVDELPEEEDIGKEFGGGQFLLVHYTGGGNRIEKCIWIDELWTKRLEESRRVNPGPPQPPADFLNKSDPLEYFSRMVNDMLKPMLSVMQMQQAPQSSENQFSMVQHMFESMTESMAASLGKVQSAIIDKQLERIEAPPAERPESDKDKMGFIREILEIAKEFGGALLGANGVKRRIMEQAIKQDERFKQLQEDPDLFDALYTEAVSDPDIGREKANKLFSKLGFEVGKE